jgi:hypothetical protein
VLGPQTFPDEFDASVWNTDLRELFLQGRVALKLLLQRRPRAGSCVLDGAHLLFYASIFDHRPSAMRCVSAGLACV